MSTGMPINATNLNLDLDSVTSDQLQKYMQFVGETNQYPQYGLAAHVVSLLSFALEEHETFQRWLEVDNGARRTRIATATPMHQEVASHH